MKTILKGVFVCCLAFAFNAAATTPLITSQPQSLTINNASTANFAVVATNAATYQWLFGTNVISGATNATLNLDDVATNQAGPYTVVVTSSTGNSSNSQPAQLTIVPGTIVQITISTYPNGTSSNFLVQLFDHDKPATVENFIHYITSGSYSNMFFDRCIPGFVLQGGDYVTTDRTSSLLNSRHVSTGTNIFPAQVDNEFNVGPFIPNTFGTLAMALVSGEPDSATSAFFINLADNSANLDNQNGGFTVFGRILSGANILQYFDTLSAPANGIYDLNPNISTLPVNYDSTNGPSDGNLFYCDFAFQTPPPIDNVPPRVAITSPAANSAFAVGSSVNVTGVASDNVGLAEVYFIASAITGFYEGQSLTNAATGTTNWSYDLGSLPPGIYELTAFSQDGAGNLSTPAIAYFTNGWQLTVITNVGGFLTTNTQLVAPDQQYSVTAAPGAGELFEDWQNQGVVSLDPVQSFTAETNITLTVTLVSNNLPAGLAISSPSAGSSIQTTGPGDITISGILPASAGVTQVTCQFFSQSNAVTPALSANLNGANWSLTVSNLPGGPYTVVVVAVDSSGREGLITENFTSLFSPPLITSQPSGLTINTGSTAAFSVSASNVVTYQWLFGTQPIAGATNATLTFEDVSTNQAGLYSVVMTASTGASINSQSAQLTIIPGTIVQLAFSGYAAGGTSNVVLQLFDHDKPATVQNFLHYITSGAYSNMFWTRCVPGFVLQGGDYFASDRTNGPPPSLNSVNSTFTQNLGYNPLFPFQIDNEYGVGPLIPNTFGTIAMAKSPGQPDSAANTFFFNLADNSTNLDTEDGGFTVFGRILSGTNILDYFNTFKPVTIFDRVNTSGAPTNGLFNSGQAPFDTLPVNYYGLNTPGDSNLFYVDFTIPAPPVLDTNIPTVAYVYPANNATVTNADVIVSGTASDDVGLARIVCSITSPTYNGGAPAGNNAIGATNWSLDFGNLPPGTYTADVVAQDGAGNLSSRLASQFTVPQFPVSTAAIGPGKLSTNLTQANTVAGSTYTVKSLPAKGALFVDWTSGTNSSVDATDSFVMPNGLQLTATFVSNTLPGGIAFTYPAANASLHTNSVGLTGTVAKSAGLTTITCQFFSKTSTDSVTAPMVTTGTATWSIPPVQLAPGTYIVQALAINAAGKTTVISENFTVLAPVTVNIIGPGKTSIANGAYLQLGAKYSIKATPNSGGLFYNWSGPSGTSSDTTVSFTMSNGFSLNATFLSNSLAKLASFTYPAANSTVATNTFLLTGNVSANVNNPQIIFQLFSGITQVGSIQYATVNGTTWSVPMSALQEGSYTAVAIASDSAGRQTLISENFKVNVYTTISGTYYGVFFNTNSLAPTNAGFFKLSLSSSGLVTGTLQYPTITYTLPGFQLNSTGGLLIPGYFDGAEVLQFDMQFDLTKGSDTVSGYVNSYGTYAYYTGYRAVTHLPANSPAGKYVLNLETITNQAASGPTNDGFATLTVGSTGSLALGGTLADNTTFTEGVGVSRDGVWPVYAKLYSGHGMLVGWETNVIGANHAAGSTGTVYWVKATTPDLYYTNGFTIEAASTGTNYIAPVAGTVYQVIFGGGSISPPLNNTLTVSHSGQFVPAAGASDKLAISLSTAGVITGTIYNPADNQKLTIHGAFSNPTLGGSGFVLDPDGQTDPFQITLVP